MIPYTSGDIVGTFHPEAEEEVLHPVELQAGTDNFWARVPKFGEDGLATPLKS